jgi:predicted DNA-binding transcriptional regulator AlpA
MAPATASAELLTRKAAAEYLNLKPRTLARYASMSRGPRYVRTGDRRGRVWYRPADLDAWLDSRTVEPTQ